MDTDDTLKILDFLSDNIDDYILDSARLNLLLQRILFCKKKWGQISNNRGRIIDELQNIYDDVNWSNAVIAKQAAWSFVNSFNNSVHSTKRTTGASKFYELVADIQGGEYCVLCGKRDNLQVDHIIPVSMAGKESDVNNMQLLCRTCNVGKSNLTNLQVNDIFDFSDEINPRMIYMVLNFYSVIKARRKHGVCQSSGATSDKAEIKVVKKNSSLAACFTNLTTQAARCNNDGGN